MLIVGSGKDDPGNVVQPREKVEARAAWHLNVEEQELGIKILDLRLRFTDSARLAAPRERLLLNRKPPRLLQISDHERCGLVDERSKRFVRETFRMM